MYHLSLQIKRDRKEYLQSNPVQEQEATCNIGMHACLPPAPIDNLLCFLASIFSCLLPACCWPPASLLLRLRAANTMHACMPPLLVRLFFKLVNMHAFTFTHTVPQNRSDHAGACTVVQICLCRWQRAVKVNMHACLGCTLFTCPIVTYIYIHICWHSQELTN